MIQFDTEHEGMIVSHSSSKSYRMIASLISMVSVWPLATAMVIPLSFNIISSRLCAGLQDRAGADQPSNQGKLLSVGSLSALKLLVTLALHGKSSGLTPSTRTS